MNIFLVPGILKNIRRSVIDGVNLPEIKAEDLALLERLKEKYGATPIRLWGVKESLRGIWKHAREGDYMLFYNNKKFVRIGRVVLTYPFSMEEPDQMRIGNELAESVWGKDVDGKTWPFLFFLADVKEIDVDLNKFNKMTGYKTIGVAGFMKVSDAKLKELEQRYDGLKNFVTQLIEVTPPPSPPPPLSKHEELVTMIQELGELIGYKPEKKWRREGYEFDVVWFKPPREGPKCVFEVHLKGNLAQALSTLKHAWDRWESQIFLVSSKESLDEAKDKFLGGTFHEIKDVITLVNISEVEDFCRFKGKFEWLERKFGLTVGVVFK
jgi:predicted RNA-binding protein